MKTWEKRCYFKLNNVFVTILLFFNLLTRLQLAAIEGGKVTLLFSARVEKGMYFFYPEIEFLFLEAENLFTAHTFLYCVLNF